MSKLFKWLVLLSTGFIVVFGYLGFHSYRALTFMDHGLQWFWVDSQFISLDTTAMQSAREHHSKQLIYRQVDVDHQLAIFLNTTNNGHFLFTFVKDAPCDSTTPYQAQLTVNNEASEAVTFDCKTPGSAVYRLAKPKFTQLQLTNEDFHFNLDLNLWDLKALKKDDYMQHNYRFFQQHSNETVYPWDRD
ncbi:hypothetical protein [Vibrio fluvialis]|uniref:hypothetical protein n=1 Tax=Vibrio fluvialis TaxID=676 RepID=UPI002B25A796|nr:hypothetical protein [Vibrio fluvialis]WPK55331.1 hypothetical protein NAF16_16710 [Vibrio fluvialis]